MLNAMDLLTMTLQRASLREALLAEEALVWPHSRVRPCVSLQIERIVEAFSAECTKVTLHVTVTLHVAIQESLKTEILATHPASETIRIVLLPQTKRLINDNVLESHDVVVGVILIRSTISKVLRAKATITLPGGVRFVLSSSRVAAACR